MIICKIWDAEYPWDVRVEKVARTLTMCGHTVHLITRNRDARQIHEVLPEATVHRMRPLFGSRGRLNDWSMFPAFFNPRWARLIENTAVNTRADIILCRDLPLAPTAIWISRRLGLPVILDMAENYPAMIQAVWDSQRHHLADWLVRNPRVVAAVERWVVQRVDRIIVVVEESRDRLVTLGVPMERITVVSNTPSVKRLEETPSRGPRSEGGPLRLAYLGLLEVPRGIGVFLDAVGHLKQFGVPVQVDIYGSGRDAEFFQNRARDLGLDVVTFHGFLPYPEAVKAVANADVGVVPHFADEGWNTTIPNKLFDYMAAGLPVLSSDARPCARIIRSTDCGEVFRDRDCEDLVRAVQRLVDPKRRAACGAAGRRAVAELYNWEQDGQRLLEAVEVARQGISARETQRKLKG